MISLAPLRVLLVDLNNFARYPTIAIGLLAALLREAGIEVHVLSPLASGLPGVVREPRPGPFALSSARLREWSANTRIDAVRRLRRAWTDRQAPLQGRALQRFRRLVAAELERDYDVVLTSTYLLYFDACRVLAEECRRRDVPLLFGGSYLLHRDTLEAWLALGPTAIAAGEAEPILVELVRRLAAREPVIGMPGVSVPGAPIAAPLPPLEDLDALPFPDYRDFPWESYSVPLVPIVTGRGCGWGACAFCSDVTSATGRRFRSRTPDHVLDELRVQSGRHGTSRFVMTDLKLNSNLAVWHALLERLPGLVSSPSWIAAVHVDGDQPCGLSRAELRAARRAGAVRLTTGLESGSQRVLDRMAKGTTLETTQRFLQDAAAEDISMRVTMILGYPDETADDVAQSAGFLEANRDSIERVMLNRFAMMEGTPVHRRWLRDPARFAELADTEPDAANALVHFRHAGRDDPAYRRSLRRLLASVVAINRRPLRDSARAFDGVM